MSRTTLANLASGDVLHLDGAGLAAALHESHDRDLVRVGKALVAPA